MSDRELAYIAIIKSLSSIPGADKIEKAEVLGWECVVKKNDFKVGDVCVYIEIDSILKEYPCFEFMRPRKFRVKTIKLKSQISQGLVMPVSILTEINPSFDLNKIKEGDNMTDILGITKYDPENLLDVDSESPSKKTWLQNKWHFLKWKLFGFKKSKSSIGFPSDVPKTDEVRVQKMGGALERCAGMRVYVSEKIEGSSITFVYRKQGNWLAKLLGQDFFYQGCSRNRIVFSSRKNVPCTHFTKQMNDKYDILNKMKRLNRNLAIQGECFGPKIQGNVYRIPDLEMKIFSAFDIDKQAYVGYEELKSILGQLDLPMVPVIDDQAIYQNDIKYYVELSKIKSHIKKDIWAEGIVIRTLDSSLSFKSINPEYLLGLKD
jgi:uncharacterized protein/RNA ligase-like protein